jgi:Tfp pilus assembly protein PilO
MNPKLAQVLTLVRRFPFAAIFLVLTLALAGAAWFFSGDVDEQELARLDRVKEGEERLKLLVGGSTQREELAAVREATRRIEENLVLETNTADNQWYFYKFEDQTKASLIELHPISAPTTDASSRYKRVPYSLRVSGTYEQVAAYLLAIETGPRLANVTAFSFNRRDKDSGKLVLELNLELLGKK